MAQLGMDADKVDGIGGQLTAQGGAIQQVINKIDSLVRDAHANWKGKDSDDFNTKWTGSYRKQLMNLMNEVNSLGATAKRNAMRQRDVSNTL